MTLAYWFGIWDLLDWISLGCVITGIPMLVWLIRNKED